MLQGARGGALFTLSMPVSRRAAAEYPRREGTLTILDQGRVEIPISTIVRSGSEVSLSVKAVGGVYAGALNADATELAGTWTQGPLSVPLTFRRAAPTEPKK